MEWHFRHIFHGQPRRHLLQSGWSVFVSSKMLVTGDAFIFLRGESGELRVGVRRAMRHLSNIASSAISSHSMHLGVLATAWHAINTKTMFTVYYKPRIFLKLGSEVAGRRVGLHDGYMISRLIFNVLLTLCFTNCMYIKLGFILAKSTND